MSQCTAVSETVTRVGNTTRYRGARNQQSRARVFFVFFATCNLVLVCDRTEALPLPRSNQRGSEIKISLLLFLSKHKIQLTMTLNQP